MKARHAVDEESAINPASQEEKQELIDEVMSEEFFEGDE